MQIRPVGPTPARIMIVGECPGEQEVLKGEPFVGSSGMELSNMLREAGIMRSECFITNVVRVRPPANDIGNFIAMDKKSITGQHLMIRDKFCLPVVRDGLELLKREIELCRPHVIIALGNVSLWALTGEWGIMSWRGSMMQTDLDLNLDYQPKVIPTYHPAVILRQWSWRQIAIQDLRRAKMMSQSRELIRPDYNFVIRPDFPTAKSVLEQLLSQLDATDHPLRLVVDIETRAGHISCLGMAWSRLEAICIPLMQVTPPALLEKLAEAEKWAVKTSPPKEVYDQVMKPLLDQKRRYESGYWSEDQEVEIVWLLYRILTHVNVEVIGQNFSYDAQYIYRHLLFLPRLKRDTMLAQHVMFSNMQKALDFLSSMYCDYHVFWKDDGKEFDPRKHDESRHWTYNCTDCVITFEVDEAEQATIDKMGLREVHDFQQRLFWPVLQTMNRGLRVDTKRRAAFAFELQEEIAKREQWMIDVLGFPVNIKSPKQMQEVFYDVLKQKSVVNRKTGNISADDESLRKIAEREPLLLPIVRKIQELRSLGVFLSTFVNAPLDSDGRMRCSFNIAGTGTYRFSSSKNAFGSGLNLQNIPKGGEAGDGLELPNVRSLFIPDPGNTFFDIDLSSADLRIVVWEADEPEMKAMLREGLDPYTEIAKEFYSDPTINKKDPRRQTFKSFAHGTNYLGTAKGLAERLGLSVHDAERTQSWYFGRFPRIKKWQDDLKDQVFKRRMVQNVFGYRQYFFDRIEGTIFNQAAAWIPQSTVACLINRAYVKIYETLPEVEVLLQVHDSLAGQFPTHLGDWTVNRIVAAAEIPLPYDGDPLIIPVGVKTSTESWGACD